MAELTILHQYDKSPAVVSQLVNAKQQLQILENYQLEGAKIRSKLFYIEQAEKHTKFFFARAKARQAKTWIKELKATNGSMATGKALLEVVTRYYTKLFGKKPIKSNAQKRLLNFIQLRLEDSLKQSLNKELTIKELQDALEKLKKNKSPGTSGLTAEFYQQFPYFLDGLLMVWKDSVRTGKAPPTFQIGAISLIYKKNDKREIGNYRPITLLNTDYKIIAKAFALRLREVIGKVVGENQRGFIPQRDIRANILECLMVRDAAQRSQIPAGLVFFDMEKAFDRVDRDYIWTTMEMMNLGSSFTYAMKLLHTGTSAIAVVNGFRTKRFQVDSGVRQGCPIAPLLYAISTEPFRSMVELDTQFNGLTIHNVRLTIHLYADDTNGFISSKQDIQRIQELFTIYEDGTGSKLNTNKCAGFSIYGLKEEDFLPFKFLQPKDIEWALGYPMGSNSDAVAEQQITEKVNKKVEIWSKWPLTASGKAIAANTSIFSHLWYLSQFIHSPNGEIWNKFRSEYWAFVQRGTLTRWKYTNAIKPKKLGGIGALSIVEEVEALKAHWIVRLLRYPAASWARILTSELCILAKKHKIKNVLGGKWPQEARSESLLGEIIYCWSKVNIQMVWYGGTHWWKNSNGDWKSIQSLSVKELYRKLNPNYQEVVSLKIMPLLDEMETLTRWKWLAQADHIAPKDKELKMKIWTFKLWTGYNRVSKLYPSMICPVCGTLETDINHPVNSCLLVPLLLYKIRQRWFTWTNQMWLMKWWTEDWIDLKQPFHTQLDTAMTLAKQALWNNYTAVVHNSPPLSASTLFELWLNMLKFTVTSKIWKLNMQRQTQDPEKWNLNNTWATFSTEWKVNLLAFSPI